MEIFARLIRKLKNNIGKCGDNDEVTYDATQRRLTTLGTYCAYDYASGCVTDTIVYDSTGKRLYYNYTYTNVNRYCPSLTTVSYNPSLRILTITSKRFLCGQ